MNLAGNQAKQLFKSLRTGGSPSVVGLWAAATAVDQMRKRSQRPDKELLISKKLKPGESYVIRMPGKDEGSLAESLSPGTSVATIDAGGEDSSITSQLLSAATELIGAAAEPSAEPESAPKLSRRQRRKAARTEEPGAAAAPKQSRRQRRKADQMVAEQVEPAEASNGSFAATVFDVAASFVGGDEGDAVVETPPVPSSRRKRRRVARLASLDETEIDPDGLRRRRREKLDRAERRARKRPSRKRVRKARHQQKRAAKSFAKIERSSQPGRRRRRKIRAAERNVDYRQAKVEKRSTRRRRRKLRKAEKAYERLT